jgi:metal-responsive CopG/Arc/MetJ family transcriptional regulator
MRMMINLPKEQVDALEALVNLGMSPTRTALIQQIISAFISDIKNQRPKQNPSFMESALGALAGVFLFALGAAALQEIFGGE